MYKYKYKQNIQEKYLYKNAYVKTRNKPVKYFLLFVVKGISATTFCMGWRGLFDFL